MFNKPVETKEDADRLARLRNLQRRAEEFVGSELSFFESQQMSLGLQGQCWEHVEAYEQAEWRTSFELLTQEGIELPAPEELDDAQLAAKLWEVIHGLAMLRMFLYNTDHLSDRELYQALWREVLQEENPDMADNDDSVCHIDLVSGGSEEDIALYLRYYADEETRCAWAKDWPNEVIPAHETPPYDRDRHLPTPAQAERQDRRQLS